MGEDMIRPPARRMLAVAAAALSLLVLPSCGGGDAAPTAVAVETTTSTSTTSTTTSTSTTTTTLPPVLPAEQLTQPVDSPPPRAAEPYVVIGYIAIPKLGLREPIAEGITLNTIDRGPGHWPGSALPGKLGNVVVAGHRVTHTRPFRHIDSLVPGDEVIFEYEGARYVYRMTSPEIVTPAGMHITRQTPAYTATLFACHPPGSAKYRYVVHLEMVRPSV
jgi:sortase A